MLVKTQSYSHFIKFTETFSGTGFNGMNIDDPLVNELEELMEENSQFFVIADFIRIQVLFTSKRSKLMMGIDPTDITPYHFFEATHPDDIYRHSLGRSKLFKIAQELFIAEKGYAVLSTNLKIRNTTGEYTNMLFQCYLFYSSLPYKTVYLLEVHTNIDWYKNIKNHYHYYIGYDISFFRFPDEDLLKIGHNLSDREYEIVKLISAGLSSEQIAAKLFLSIHTINTHRSNILEKTQKASLPDLIYDFKERGLL